jgi:glyoxylase-like metal-dependent hydrolase (beta-lactamase superfamily II)
LAREDGLCPPGAHANHGPRPHLIKLTRQRWVNCYLVREPDGFTLIDTTLPGSARAIVRAAAGLGSPITRITITHGHGDHVGSVDALAAEIGDAEVAFPAREARFLSGDSSLDPGEPGPAPRNIRRLKTAPSRELAPGDRLGSLEVVPCPGHSPGHVAFLDTRDRTLIAGDAYATLGSTAVTSRLNPRFPLPYFGTWDKPGALRSGRALRALEPARLAVGHGRVLEEQEVLAEMDRALAAAG